MKLYIYNKNSNAPIQTIRIKKAKSFETLDQYHEYISEIAENLASQVGDFVARDEHLQSIFECRDGSTIWG
jgi:hypothetical protein